MPDDGHRYELLDGTLLVTPGPSWPHQEVGLALALQLRDSRPPGFRVLVAPFAVTFGRNDSELQPDVLVARYVDLTQKNLPAAPVLAVEVRSPSTALVDLNLKKAAYERFGVGSYWLVDPDVPSLIVFELGEDGYLEVATATGNDAVTLDRPFPVTVCPNELRRGLDPD